MARRPVAPEPAVAGCWAGRGVPGRGGVAFLRAKLVEGLARGADARPLAMAAGAQPAWFRPGRYRDGAERQPWRRTATGIWSIAAACRDTERNDGTGLYGCQAELRPGRRALVGRGQEWRGARCCSGRY